MRTTTAVILAVILNCLGTSCAGLDTISADDAVTNEMSVIVAGVVDIERKQPPIEIPRTL